MPGTGIGGVLTLVPRDETRWLTDWRGGFTGWIVLRGRTRRCCLCLCSALTNDGPVDCCRIFLISWKGMYIWNDE